MLHTDTSAERKLPQGLFPSTTQAWYWVEFAINIPYFLLRLNIRDGDDFISQHLITNEIEHISELAALDRSGTHLVLVNLLSPNYMNDTDDYQLGRLKEIWRENADPYNYIFILEDGCRISSTESRHRDLSQCELLVSLPTGKDNPAARLRKQPRRAKPEEEPAAKLTGASGQAPAQPT